MKLLFINIRALQASATGPYGNRSVETFTLNALAAQGVVFDRHLSVHPEAGLAHAVWRTGRYQFAPGAAAPDLLTLLREKEIQTHLLVDVQRPITAEISAGWEHVHTHTDTASTLEAGGKLLAHLPEDASWLVWLDLSALLPPWDVPDEIIEAYFAPPEPDEEQEEEDEEEEEAYEEVEPAEEDLLESEEEHEPLMAPPIGKVDPADDDLYLRVQKSYAAAVSHVDILLGHLLDGMPDDVLVIVTSDHGQSLAEHGIIGPSLSLHAEVVHVPLIFAGSGCRAGRHVGALTASLDVAVTIAELAGVQLTHAHGQSLVAMLAEQETAKWPYIALGIDTDGHSARALWTPERTLILPTTEQEQAKLYVKPDDRFEVNDVSKHELERVEAMERTVLALVEAASRPGALVLPELEQAP